MRIKDILIKIWLFLASTIVICCTLFVFLYILIKGIGVINLEFIFGSPKGMPLGTEGGIFPAIVGTILLGMLSSFFSSIIAFLLSVYLCYYCKSNSYSNILKSIMFFCSGIPSVIFGLVFYNIFIYKFGVSRSLFTASITIAVMILPFITLQFMQIFNDESHELFLTSLSIGYTKSYTIFSIIMRKNYRQFLSATALSMSYGIGATAPIMYTGAVLYADVPHSVFQPFMSLPYHLYFLIADGISIENAYGTAFVLMILILIINFIPRYTIQFRKLRDEDKYE
ncbi:MAG: PstA family ABC transporter permease [Lachnospirales bacterium]